MPPKTEAKIFRWNFVEFRKSGVYFLKMIVYNNFCGCE